MTKQKSEIKELEEIARKFIIGYAPLTDKQRGILIDIRMLEEQREALHRNLKRYDRTIQALYNKLAGTIG